MATPRPVEGPAQRVAEQEVEDAAGEMGRRVEERPPFPVEAGEGVEGAQGRDGQGEPEGPRAEAAEEEEAEGQQGGRQAADLPAAHPAGREDAGGLVGVDQVGAQAGPVVEQEDVRHQGDVGGDEERQRPQVRHRRVAEREGGAEQRGALEDQDLLQAQAGQIAAQALAETVAGRGGGRDRGGEPCRESLSHSNGNVGGAHNRQRALARAHSRRPPTSSTGGPSR